MDATSCLLLSCFNLGILNVQIKNGLMVVFVSSKFKESQKVNQLLSQDTRQGLTLSLSIFNRVLQSQYFPLQLNGWLGYKNTKILTIHLSVNPISQ